MVVAQLVRVLVCGAEGRGFEPHQPPQVLKAVLKRAAFFVFRTFKLFNEGCVGLLLLRILSPNPDGASILNYQNLITKTLLFNKL